MAKLYGDSVVVNLNYSSPELKTIDGLDPRIGQPPRVCNKDDNVYGLVVYQEMKVLL